MKVLPRQSDWIQPVPVAEKVLVRSARDWNLKWYNRRQYFLSDGQCKIVERARRKY